MRLVRSRLLAGTPHGFSTRLGGVSSGRFASLNLGASWGDDPARVDENRHLLARDGGYAPDRLRTARQVHGAACLVADGADANALAKQEADALCATEPGLAVGVFTADCVPILLADDRGHVAAVHAGWRGTVSGIARAALDVMVSLGSRRDRVRAALGPSIGPCCFEVGEEVAEQFDALAPVAVLRANGRHPHVDLWLANALILEAAGVRPERIDAHPPCTMCDAERFFSFRRDGAGIGQMLSFIVAGPR